MRGVLLLALAVASSDGYGGGLPSSASSSFFRGGCLHDGCRYVPPLVGGPCCDFNKQLPPLRPAMEPVTMRKQKASDKRTRRAQRFGSEAEPPSSAGGRGRGSLSSGSCEDDDKGEPAADATVLERASVAFKFKTKKPTAGGPGGAATAVAGSAAGNTRSRSAKKQRLYASLNSYQQTLLASLSKEFRYEESVVLQRISDCRDGDAYRIERSGEGCYDMVAELRGTVLGGAEIYR